jgi:hypothetical protein
MAGLLILATAPPVRVAWCSGFRQQSAREGKTPSRIARNCRSNDNKTSNALLVFKLNDALPFGRGSGAYQKDFF